MRAVEAYVGLASQFLLARSAVVTGRPGEGPEDDGGDDGDDGENDDAEAFDEEGEEEEKKVSKTMPSMR